MEGKRIPLVLFVTLVFASAFILMSVRVSNLDISSNIFYNTKENLHPDDDTPSTTLPVLPYEFTPQPYIKKIFYNRIPKTGSTSMYTLISALHNKMNYTYTMLPNEKVFEHRFFTIEEIIKFVNKYFANKPKEKAVVIKHLLYIDFNRVLDFEDAPKYINQVRSPFDRFVSNYNYMRFKSYHPKITPKDFKNLPINKCINTRHVECAHPNSTMVMVRFFCGHDPICLLEGKAAVNLAKRNIEKDYIAVGLLERRRESMVVFEHLLPQFFIGITEMYDAEDKKKKSIKNVTKWRQIPSKNETLILKDLLKYDQEIYDFIAQRFEQQYQAIMDYKNYTLSIHKPMTTAIKMVRR